MYFNAAVWRGATVQRAIFFYLKMHQKLLGGRAPPGPAGETYRLTVPSGFRVSCQDFMG